MILNTSYFVGDLYIPQVGSGSSSVANNNELLLQYIEKYEVGILVKGLGRKLCKEFYSNIDAAGNLITSADAKWGRLLNGHEYDDKYWRGLVDRTGNLNESLMAFHVYYHYVRDGQRKTSTMGTKKGNSQNSTSVSATTKLVNAWRQLHKWYYGTNADYYESYMVGGVIFEDFHGGNNTNDVGLKQFMEDNISDYPYWSFSSIGENVNEFGI